MSIAYGVPPANGFKDLRDKSAMETDLNITDRRRRLIFRAWHRGIKELDLIFGNYLDKHIDEMDHDDCAWFEALFEENDHDILAWIMNNKPTPEAFDTPIMDAIKKLDFMTLKAR